MLKEKLTEEELKMFDEICTSLHGIKTETAINYSLSWLIINLLKHKKSINNQEETNRFIDEICFLLKNDCSLYENDRSDACLEIKLSKEEEEKLKELDRIFSGFPTRIGLVFATTSMISFLQKSRHELNDPIEFNALKNRTCDFIKNYETLCDDNENKS